MSKEGNLDIVSAEDFRHMVQAAAQWLEQHKETVDRMNVFPVPDGDTGTNMSLTMRSAEKFALKADPDDIGQVADQMAYGALMGARGNSGVILSQILAGIAEEIKSGAALTGTTLAAAFASGAEYAYRAVSNPKEGTILTVVREVGEAMLTHKSLPPLDVLRMGMEAGKSSLARTPELLPVLKQAGVVDAGGQGFLYVLEGMAKGLAGEVIEGGESPEVVAPEDVSMDNVFNHFFDSPEEIVYPYCTEFLVHTSPQDLNQVVTDLKTAYDAYGDSMVVVGTGSMVKVHIHTDRLDQVLGLAQAYGELDDIKINNMRSQHRALQTDIPLDPGPEIALITVSNGEGFTEIFKSLGATEVIQGGQTMNPSTEDFLQTIDKLGSKKAFLFPNNKNIILAADQAARLSDNAHIHVVPTKSIPQGIAALLEYDPDQDEATNLQAMMDGFGEVLTGEVTVAVRDTTIDGVAIGEGQKMAMADGKILSTHESNLDALRAIIAYAAEGDHSFVSLYAGQAVADEDVEDALEVLETEFPDMEFESHRGQQAVYDYIVSAEI